MNWYSELRVDAMYFDFARQHLQRAKDAAPSIAISLQRLAEAQTRWETLEGEQSLAGVSEASQEMESVAISMESLEISLSRTYGPQLQSLAGVHLAAAASLEAYINGRAEAKLKRSEWEAFERCSLDGKIMFFPRIMGAPGFTCGVEPLQGLGRLVSRRNKLIHFKTTRVPWRSPHVPTFLERLGLTIEAGEDAVITTQRLVSEVSRQLGEGVPIWLELEGEFGYFDIRYHDGTSMITQSIQDDVIVIEDDIDD